MARKQVDAQPRSRLLTSAQVAERLQCSPSHARALLAGNRLPGVVRIGGLVRCREDLLEAFIEGQSSPAPTPSDWRQRVAVRA